MTDSQSNSLDMFLVVNGFYLANLLVIDAVPARTAAFGTLATNIAAINTQIAGQSANTTGVTQDKAAVRTTLNSITMSLLSPAKAWAVNERNNTLLAEFDYSLSDIQRIKDDSMKGFCEHRLQLIEDHILGMADYGIQPPSLVSWQSAIDTYASILESPREAINSRHLKTANLKVLFKETSLLLRNQIDPLMVPLKTLEPQVYQAYKQARIIIDRGRGPSVPTPQPTTATLFGAVTNAETGAPIGAAVLLVSSSPESSFTITTNDNGTFSRSGIEPNQYLVTCLVDGFFPYENTIILEASASFELNISLVPQDV